MSQGRKVKGQRDEANIWVFNHSVPTDITTLKNAQVLKLSISVLAPGWRGGPASFLRPGWLVRPPAPAWPSGGGVLGASDDSALCCRWPWSYFTGGHSSPWSLDHIYGQRRAAVLFYLIILCRYFLPASLSFPRWISFLVMHLLSFCHGTSLSI